MLREALRAASLSDVARRSGIPRRSLQSVLDGHVPSLERAADICAALGLELSIGPRRLYGRAPKVEDLGSIVEMTGGEAGRDSDRALARALAAIARALRRRSNQKGG